MQWPNRGVRRVALASLNPKVCPSNQLESDPMLKNQSESDPKLKNSIRIRSEVKKVKPIRSNPKQNTSDPIRIDAKNS